MRFVGVSGWTIDGALDLAVSMEERSIQLYTSAQEKAGNPASREMLRELAAEEEGHRKRLLDVKENRGKSKNIGAAEKVLDLKIVDNLEKRALSPAADYQQILIFAGNREKEAHDMYLELARKNAGGAVSEIFARLAQEELKHKHRIEREYDDVVLAEM